MPVLKLATPLLRRSTRALSTGIKAVAPHPVPRLPVIDELEQRARVFLSNSPLKPEETAVIGAQHLLETTSTLFGALRGLGFEAYVTGKCYSTSPGVYEAMKGLGVHVWPGSKPDRLGGYEMAAKRDIGVIYQGIERNPKIKNIVICDDGGRFFEMLPLHFRKTYKIVGAEQTRAGFYSRTVETTRFPIINVAQSAAKLHVEPSFIADASVEQISAITMNLDKQRSMVGIIGFGSIGQALTNKLIKDGFSVAIYDNDSRIYQHYPNISQVEVMSSIEELFLHTNFIIGCTGRDTTDSFDPLTLTGDNRILASVSSEDKEFKHLLQQVASYDTPIKVDPLSNFQCSTKSGSTLEILYGGFPVNFSNSATQPFNVPAPRIALTQGLLFAGIMQAFNLLGNRELGATNVMLDPELQRYVVKVWLETTIKENNLPRDAIDKILGNVQWVIDNSKGAYDTDAMISKAMCPPPISTTLTKAIN